MNIIEFALFLLNENYYLRSILKDKDEDYPYLIYKYISRYNKIYDKNIEGVDKKVIKKIIKNAPINKIILEKKIANAVLFEESNKITLKNFK